ncbi:MAG TPA: PilN domain-containing protein [Steroidobacteraceae bacterium]|nr:PilN domain-containing protein [Steroidobacteraceae bacterium]
MPQINLLPWRAEKRKERKLKFFIALGGATALALLITGVGYVVFESMISAQQHRNELLQARIKDLDKQIEEINALQSAKQKFISRMEIIEKLQHSRPQIVHVFDEIVKTLPDGTYLTAVKETGKRLRFDGVAQSSTRVSAFMRNIDASDYLKNPELQVVAAGNNSSASNFVLFADEAGGDELADQGQAAKAPLRRGGK